MEESFQIKGINKSEYPILYAVLERNMTAYNIKKVKVKILEHGFEASVFSLIGDSLRISKKLLEILNEEELEAIVAHEFSHIFNRDSFVRIYITILFSIPLICYAITFILKINKFISDVRLIIFMLTYFIVSFYIFNIGLKIRNWVSVQQEIRSDWEALLKTKNPESLKNALFKMDIEPFTINKRPSLFDITSIVCNYLLMYFHGYTHPISKERLEYLELAERMLKAQKLEMGKR